MEDAERTITSLIDALGDPDSRTRRRAADALGKLGASALAALMKALKDRNSKVRAGAADAMRRMGARAAAAVPLLIEALKDKDQEVAANAARALGACGPAASAAIPALIEALSAPGAEAAVKALRQLRPAAEPALLAAIDRDDYLVSHRAAEALWTLDSEAVPSLIKSLSDSDLRLRRGATRALGSIRGLGLEAVLALVETLTDEDPRVRGNAARAVAGAEHEVQRVVSALMNALRDEDENVRAIVIDVLASFGREAAPAIPELMLLINEFTAPRVRNHAVEALGRLGPVAVPALVKQVKRRDSPIGWEAVRILKKIGPQAKRGIPALIEAIKDDDEGVRERGSACLVAIGSEAVPTLIELLSESDPPFREDVTETLLAIDRTLVDREEKIKDLVGWRDHLPNVESAYDVEEHHFDGSLLFFDQLRGSRTAAVKLPPESQRQLLDELGKTASQHFQIKEAIAASESAVGRAAPSSIPSVTQLKPPLPRYTDITFYEENKFKERTKRLLAQRPVKLETWYQIEVAIRENRTGDTMEGVAQPIGEPKQSRDVELIVTAESKDFKIENPVRTLVLPPIGDSLTQAYFRVCPQKVTANVNRRSRIDIRVFYKFNLLALTCARVEVVAEDDDDAVSAFGSADARTVEHVRVEGDLTDFDEVLPRQMHIDITRDDSQFQFTFTYLKGSEDETRQDDLVLTASIQLDQEALKGPLSAIRKTLLGIVMTGVYGEVVEGQDEVEFTRQVTSLARQGLDLWTTLFRLDETNSLFVIGDFLKNNPLKAGSMIQVSSAPEVSGLVFPWNLLYDGKMPEAGAQDLVPPLDGFWGLRYVIEQRLPNMLAVKDEPIDYASGLEVGLMLWNFAQAQGQSDFIKELLTRSGGHLATGEPIRKAQDAFQYLEDCHSHILYFYTHGHTRVPDSNIGALTLKDFEDLYKTLSSSSPDYEAWEMLHDEIEDRRFTFDYSWIGLSIGKLSLLDLYGKNIKLRNRPIVILNMCESAQVTPDLSVPSFIHFFINRNARSVIGTECSITPLFADHFSRVLFQALLRGGQIGQILLDLRKQFMSINNPLGLAYTLYGSATVRFDPPPIPGDAAGPEKANPDSPITNWPRIGDDSR